MTELSLSPGGISLRGLFADDLRGGASIDVRATSCTSDWRYVRTGDVFVGLAGQEDDGHERAIEAAKRGAVALVCERPLPVFDIPQFVVSDSRVAYGRLCQALMRNPSQQLKVIAVTGSHGKTTLARLIASILRKAGARAGMLDSFGYWDGLEDPSPIDAQLSAPRLARSLAEMVASRVSHAIVEVSSRELSQQVLAGVEVDSVCVTHITRRHLDWHGSVENYRQVEGRIFEYLRADGVAILNADDPVSVHMLSDLNFPALTYGMQRPGEITAEIVDRHINEQTFLISAGDETAAVRTEIVGDHHVFNCLAAAAMCLAYGVDLTTIARGLETVSRLPGRMERVVCGQDFGVLVDAAGTAESLRACLGAARQVTRGRVICVFSADRDCRELQASGRVVGAMSDLAVITTGPRDRDPSRACIELQQGFANPSKAQIIVDRTKAIFRAIEEARAGDTVIVAGMGEKYGGRVDAEGNAINDAEIVRQILQGTHQRTSKRRAAA